MLLVDAGNTRIKWQLRSQVESVGGSVDDIEALASQFSLLALRGQQLVVASVRGDDFFDSVATRFSDLAPAPIHCLTAAEFNGLVNGYADYRRLGIDRWLAIIGARGHVPVGELVVVDVGTALTVDYVDADNRHHGGYIVPGFTTLVQSLNQHTHRIAVSALALERATDFGATTDEAVNRGCQRMLSALVADIGAQYPLAEIVCTGGGADLLGGVFDGRTRICKDLIFDGMAYYVDAYSKK